MVQASFVIQAETRYEAFHEARKFTDKNCRSLVATHSIPQDPLPDPKNWIAVNEPIKAQG